MSDNINNTNSLLCSVVIYSLVSYLCCLPGWLTGVVFAVLGSQLNMVLPENYRNSLICIIPLAVASYWYPIIFLPVAVGFLSSILIGLLSRGGCKLLYPLSKTNFTGPANYLERGSKEDKSATTFLLVLAVIAVVLSMFGNEILSDINENEGIMNYYTHRSDGTSYAQSSGNGYGGSNRYGENNSGYIHYVYIETSKHEVNRNITTYNVDNNTTTTIITEYKPPADNTT